MKDLSKRLVRHRKGEYITIKKELFMLTIERLDAAIGKVQDMDKELADLKTKANLLQLEVTNGMSPDVQAKADQLVTALIGPEASPMLISG